jgi:hypothetical protein
MLITAAQSARYRALADDIDAALARGDEIGMDLLKSLLPDLTQAIEEINTGLREVDALLFEGLRDEAIGLHDSDLPAVAARLHMPDKPQWPIAAAFFEDQGIQPPPSIDFASLASLNAAYAEVERLSRPLDRLRRLALERASLSRKIQLLRKLRAHDSSKPVWGDQLASHEQVRSLELTDAVKQAFAARSPEAIAALHEELADPAWSIPLPGRLKKDTEGGHVWAGLRTGVRNLEATAETIHREFTSHCSHDDADVVHLDALRQARDSWNGEESRCRDLLFALPQHTAIAPLTHDENFGPRMEAARARVTPALEWLATMDQADWLEEQFRRTCNELDMLADTLPARKGEAAWVARVEKLEADLRQLCQQMPHMKVADSLPLKIERAVGIVRHRTAKRSRTFAISLALGLAGLIPVVWGTTHFVQMRRLRREIIEYVDRLIPEARKGGVIARPERLQGYALQFEADPQLGSKLDELDNLILSEQARRDSFEALLSEHESLVAETLEAIADRDADQTQRLEEWPPAVSRAQEKYRDARLKGGLPNKRRTDDRKPRSDDEAPDELPLSAARRLDEEETRLAQQESKQSQVERRLASAANEEFTRQLQEIIDEIPDTEAPDRSATATQLLERLKALLDEARRPRFSDGQTTRRVGSATLDLAQPVSVRLNDLIRD